MSEASVIVDASAFAGSEAAAAASAPEAAPATTAAAPEAAGAAPPASRRRWRRVAVSLGVIAGAALVVLGLLELGLRVAYRASLTEQIYAPSPAPALGYTLQPSLAYRYAARARRVVITTDGAGRRVVPGAPAAAPHTLHVIGDSQVFGWQLADDETIPAGLQRRLGSRWRVVNHGVPGYGPLAYAELLRRVPAGELALVVQTEANDLRDALSERPETRVRCGFLMTHDLYGDYFPCFVLGSYTFTTALMAQHRLGDTRVLLPLGFAELGESAATVLRLRVERAYAAASADGGSADDRLVAVVPWDAALVSARLVYYKPELARAERRVALPADVDLEPAFRRHPDPDRLFLAADHHLSAAGAALVADELAPHLQALAQRRAPEGRP